MTANHQKSLVTAVIVSYNRCRLLERCINALNRQSLQPNQILIVDNASSDETRSWLSTWSSGKPSTTKVVYLDENTGGAGGFSEGLRIAIANGADWIWMMDDDAEPHSDALAELMKKVDNRRNIYGSLAVHASSTSWVMTLKGNPPVTVTAVSDIPVFAEVQFIPFLGFLIHRELVESIGLPDAGFFIAADDVEYCVRAQRAGAKIFVAGRSHIEHPQSYPYKIRFLGYELTCLALPPWKRYYDTRNRLLISRRHFGSKLFTQTIPGSFARLVATLLKEPHKFSQFWAFIAGFIDGLFGLKGKRHDKWGIRQ